jgi:NADP-dependent 3-hydroxy acid dehydrogenase YdfG
MDTQRTITGFGAQSTAAEVAAGIDLTGHRVIVTGGASGIGVETARALAGAKELVAVDAVATSRMNACGRRRHTLP